jgi:hypothetical protein
VVFDRTPDEKGAIDHRKFLEAQFLRALRN